MNNKLQKLKELSLQEWWLLLVAVIMLPVVALLLGLAGYNRTRNLLSKFIPEGAGYKFRQQPEADEAKIVARMVSVAVRSIPLRINCLRQSMVLWWLLARRGLVSEIRFGIKKEPEDEFGAHAWVEFNGINLCDSEVLQRQVSAFKKSAEV